MTNLSAVCTKFKAFSDETLFIIITLSLEKRKFLVQRRRIQSIVNK